MPSVVMALGRALRAFGGAPTYALTENERMVSIDQICGLAVRNPQIVSVGRHYGLTIASCVPADPESKDGSEATVRIAKADLVPTEHNLRAAYEDFVELEAACEELFDRVNTREHRVTRRVPAVMLAEERARLHPLPAVPHTVCFGQTRKVSWQYTISVGGALYSLPSEPVDERVRARADGSELVVVHAAAPDGPHEVARHELTTPGRPSIRDRGEQGAASALQTSIDLLRVRDPGKGLDSVGSTPTKPMDACGDRIARADGCRPVPAPAIPKGVQASSHAAPPSRPQLTAATTIRDHTSAESRPATVAFILTWPLAVLGPPSFMYQDRRVGAPP